MEKTCNLSTVKNTPSEARRHTHTLYYYIEYAVRYDDLDDYHYDSVLQIISSIFNVLEFSSLSSLDGAIIRAAKSDNTFVDLYLIKNDIDNKSLVFKRL